LDRGSIKLRETLLLLGSFVLIAIALWNGQPADWVYSRRLQRELAAQDHGSSDEPKALRT
jgi:hypothetical protein